VLSTACKLELELNGISDRGKGVLCCQERANWNWNGMGYLIGEREFCVVNSVQIGTGTEWDI
jgi:hypothetical protein